MLKNKSAGNASINKHPKYAQLTLDFTFKKAFAEEECKELLILSEPEFTEFIGFTEFPD